jgi:hypothetical protein
MPESVNSYLVGSGSGLFAAHPAGRRAGQSLGILMRLIISDPEAANSSTSG